jgi:hypothetical protein
MKNVTKSVLITSLFVLGLGCANEKTKEIVSPDTTLTDQVIYQRAFDAVIWAMPATGIYNLRKGVLALPGVDDNVIAAYSAPLLSKHKAITSNAATPYISAYSDLRNGPTVLVLPAKSDKASLYGQVVDAWQSTIADVGPSGLDQGKGGKYLFLPPGYEGKIPKGYIVVQSNSYRIGFAFRSVRTQDATDADAYAYTQNLKMYYLSEEPNPKLTRFVDGLQYPLETLPNYDISIFEDIHAIISVEPVRECDKIMMGMLATIGIEPRKSFNPSEKTKEIFVKAAKDADQYMHTLVWQLHERGKYWQDRYWSFVMLPDDNGGFDFIADSSIEIDKRAAAWNFFTFYPKVLSEKPATVYLAPIADNNGNKIDSGKLYKINVPKNIPVKQFWSITVYDEANWGFIDNSLGRSGLGLYNKPAMKVNADESIDIYFGPKAPKGLESNWIPTEGKKPYVWLRLYGPDEAFWDKSYVMPDVVLVDSK